MNSYLNLVSGKTKTASAEPQYQEIDLSQISGADLLAGLEDGSIVLPEQEKVAEEEAGDFDLSGLSEEQLLQLAEELGGQEKVASDEAESWDAAGRIFARGFLDEIDGGAEVTGDMNIRDALEKSAGIDSKVQGVGRWLLEKATPMGRRHVKAVGEAKGARDALSSAMRNQLGSGGSSHLQVALARRRTEGLRKALIHAGSAVGATASSKTGRRVAGYGAIGTGTALTGAGGYKGIQALREEKKKGR